MANYTIIKSKDVEIKKSLDVYLFVTKSRKQKVTKTQEEKCQR